MTAGKDCVLVRTVHHEEGVTELAMQNAAGKNAFSEPFVAQLLGELGRIAEPQTKVVVVTGLPDVFCSGAPRELLVKLARGEVVPSDIVLSPMDKASFPTTRSAAILKGAPRSFVKPSPAITWARRASSLSSSSPTSEVPLYDMSAPTEPFQETTFGSDQPR